MIDFIYSDARRVLAELYGNVCVNIVVVVVQNNVASDFHRQKISRLQRNNEKHRGKTRVWVTCKQSTNQQKHPRECNGRHLCHRIESWVLKIADAAKIYIAVCSHKMLLKVISLDCTRLFEIENHYSKR